MIKLREDDGVILVRLPAYVGFRHNISVCRAMKRLRTVEFVFRDFIRKVFPVNRIRKGDIVLAVIVTAVNVRPYFNFGGIGHRTDKNVGYERSRAFFKINPAADAHSCGTVMPAFGGVVVAETRCGIELVTLAMNIIRGSGTVAAVFEIVFDGDEKRVFSIAYKLRNIKFKWREKALMRAGESAVYINLGYVVRAGEMQKERPFIGHGDGEGCFVIRRRTADGTAVMRKRYVFPFAG